MDVAGNALISVYDKTGIEDFASNLHQLNWQIYASGGTYNAIAEAGIPASNISELVGGEAILGHKVVSLSREIHAGLLADLSSPQDMQELRKLNIPLINLACVDMYPLEKELANPKATATSVRANTDIGGPTILRSAAKGHRIVVSSVEQRQQVIDWLKAGRPNEDVFLDKLATQAEYEVARYTLQLALYLGGNSVSGSLAKIHSKTKYGENPQQTDAALYADNRVAVDPLGLDQFTHVKGWEKSYINLTDIDRLIQTSTHIAAGFDRNFNEVPAIAVGVKHGNACGAGVAKTHAEAVRKMLDGDTRAIFGGVVMINGEIDKEIAEILMHHSMNGDKKRLLDGIIGASVTNEAIEILTRNKLRIVTNPSLGSLSEASLDHDRRPRPVRGGNLAQPNYAYVSDLSADYIQKSGQLTEQQKRDLILAWAIGSTSNSNTVTLVKDGMLIGNGVGQQDRVGAGQLAIARTTIEIPELEEVDGKLIMTVTLDKQKLEGASAYSDSFFPFSDAPMLLAKAGIKAILTSSGSVRDKEIINYLSSTGVSMVMVPDRIGRGFYGH